jgi:hypothetical protein
MSGREGPTQRPADLWPEIERRLAQTPQARRRPWGEFVAAVVALVVFASSGVLLWQAFGPGEHRNAPTVGPLDRIPRGWTRLADPPEVRPSAGYVWTGSRLLAWGGCDPKVKDDCAATDDGFAYDPSSGQWSSMPPAPLAAVPWRSVWTGQEAIFLTGADGPLGGVAYAPAASEWRRIADAPISIQEGAVVVWTGSRIFVWGGGSRSEPALDGALYDPATDRWTTVAPSPVGLNLASGVWTGREVIVFGSLLDNGNHADTRTSVGAAYDPSADAWRMLPPSDLSPQASSVAWTGDEMVAWDYALRAQTYDPASDSWSDRERLPMRPGECYPDSAVVANEVFAFYCGEAALFDPVAGGWTQIDGGMLDARVWSDAYQRSIQLWRFADLIPAGDVLFLPAQGITLSDTGEACYGCEGSPTSFWAYRPPTVAAPSVAPTAVVYQVPFLTAPRGWDVYRSDPVRRGDAGIAWASSEPIARDDVTSGAAIPASTIAALPQDGIVVTAEAAPWERDPSIGPYPDGVGPFDLATARVRGPDTEEPPGGYAVYQMDRHGILVRVYFGASSPSAAALADAQTVLDSLQPPPVCPSPASGGYGAALSRAEGRPGDRIDVTGPMPFVREDGSFDTSGETVMIGWWNAPPDGWAMLSSFATSKPAPAVAGSPLERLGEGGRGACSFSIGFTVPDVPPGEYPIVVLQEGGGGSTMEASLLFRVRASGEAPPSLDALGRWSETDGVATILHDEDDRFTVTYPSDWFVADQPINDAVCSPFEILTLATYPLRPGGHAVIDAQLPSNAVDDLGTNDILIWLNDSGNACGGPRRAGSGDGFPERPARFGPITDCRDVDGLCPSDGRGVVPGIRGWWIAFRDAGRGFYVFVGMGERAFADPARGQLAWDVLDSLRFEPA